MWIGSAKIAANVWWLGEGCLTESFKVRTNFNGSFCQTAVMCWAVYQHKSKRKRKMLHDLKENIKARFKAKRYDIYKEQVVERGNDGYFIYNGKIYYGNRFFVFFYSNQNTWHQQKLSNGGEW